jgi:hypothetical protein
LNRWLGLRKVIEIQGKRDKACKKPGYNPVEK